MRQKKLGFENRILLTQKFVHNNLGITHDFPNYSHVFVSFSSLLVSSAAAGANFSARTSSFPGCDVRGIIRPVVRVTSVLSTVKWSDFRH